MIFLPKRGRASDTFEAPKDLQKREILKSLIPKLKSAIFLLGGGNVTNQTTERLGWRIAQIFVSVILVTFWRAAQRFVRGVCLCPRHKSKICLYYQYIDSERQAQTSIYLLMDALTSVSCSYLHLYARPNHKIAA